MQIIITMAGLGKRFHDAGYNCPKYMIEVNGKTLFEWSMDSLIDYNPHVSKYIFIVQKKDKSQQFILETMKKYGIDNLSVIEIDYLTDGQASTCMLAMPYCNYDESIMVYNIDTYVEPGALKYSDISGEGHIPCFVAPGEHWSFVKVNNEGYAVEVREKNKISNNCSLGAYYFSSAHLFMDLYNTYYLNNNYIEMNEKYIAPMYNNLINEGLKVTVSVIDSSKVHVLGTPQELEIFKKSNFM